MRGSEVGYLKLGLWRRYSYSLCQGLGSGHENRQSVCNRKTTERESISELGDENIIKITLTDTAATKTSDKSSVKESDTEPKIKILNC